MLTPVVETRLLNDCIVQIMNITTLPQNVRCIIKYVVLLQHEVAYINPAVEMQFPGIGKLHDELKTWDWTYAHSPSFSLKHSASGPLGDGTVHLSMHMTIEKGHIESAILQLTDCADSQNELLADVCQTLTGCRFWPMHVSIALISMQLHLKSPDLWMLINACFSGFLEPDSRLQSQRNNASS